MKKAVSAILFVFVVVLLLAPVYGGKKAHVALEGLVAHINATAPGSAVWGHYEQGWFTSEAVLHLDMTAYFGVPALVTEEPLVVPLQLELSHGPVILNNGLTLGWFSGRWYLDDEHEAWVEGNVQTEGEGPFFVSHFEMALTGTVEFREQTLPFAIAANNSLFSMAGYQGRGTYRPYGALTYRGGFTKASTLADDGNFLIEGAEVDLVSHLDQRRGAFAVPGRATFGIERMAMVRNDNLVFGLDDFELATSFTIEQEKPEVGDVSMQLAFGRVEFLGDIVTDGAAEVALNRMSLAFYNKYMKLMQDTNDGEGSASSLQALQVLALVNQELLPFGPELLLKQVRFSTQEGQFLMDGYLRVPEDAVKGQANPFAIVRHIDARLNVLVDKPLAFKLAQWSAANNIDEQFFDNGKAPNQEDRDAAIQSQATAQIETLLGQGFIVDKGEQFEAQLSFEKGAAVINGQTVPLPF